MNGKQVDEEILIAYEALKHCKLAFLEDGVYKMNHAYRAQISTFGTAVMNGNAVSAIAFFSREQQSNKDKEGAANVNRSKLLEVLAEVLNVNNKVKFKIGQHDSSIMDLVNYANSNGVKAKEQIINAAIAIKLAINLYPEATKSTSGDEQKEQKKNNLHLTCDNNESIDVPNMNYKYNVKYFDHIGLSDNETAETKDSKFVTECFKSRKKSVLGHNFTNENSFKEIDDVLEFELKTSFPGLLVGIGNEHDIGATEALKCGFSFDYVTGNPYIPGSELKGMLRSYFPVKDNYNSEKNEALLAFVRVNLPKGVSLTDDEIYDLTNQIFDNNDVFLGAYPVLSSGKNILLQSEYITPHDKSGIKNPTPLTFIKVRPNVPFKFSFILSDYKESDTQRELMSKDDKLSLFQKLISSCGIGAKTNVGFSSFQELNI